MLSHLKFVQGSVARKDYLPALTHFCIEKGTVRGYNGTLALCSPLPFDIECKPKALTLVQAIKNCSETIALSMTPTGRLAIKSGKFKAHIECVEGETNHVQPEGKHVAVDGKAMLDAVQQLADFVADDASRPWSNGILLKGQSAFATNNIILVEYWMGIDMPIPMNIPRAAIKEMLRIGEAPEYAQVSETSFTLHYSGKRWLRTAILSTEWPDLKRILDVPSNAIPFPEGFFEAVESVKPFVDKLGRAFFHQGSVCSSTADNDGAAQEVEGLPDGVYNVDMLLKLKDVATRIDLSTYPKPCVFYGGKIRGAIIGMRNA